MGAPRQEESMQGHARQESLRVSYVAIVPHGWSVGRSGEMGCGE